MKFYLKKFNEFWGGRLKKLVILDDCFPNLLTGFRVAEYNWLLEKFPHLEILSSVDNFKHLHKEYSRSYPKFSKRILPYEKKILQDCGFVYLNFLNNAINFLPDLESLDIPFLLTLYPGGGFALDEEESDRKLDAILSSPLLRGVIATQRVTIDYLSKRKCNVPIYDIFGGAFNSLYFKDDIPALDNKDNSISICFVADKYMPEGANKGYPEFIRVSERLLKDFPGISFNVVGRFGPEDYPLSNELKNAITFHGLLFTHDLKAFFQTQHILVSPNRPFVLSKGNFDGFPTGCAVEAMLCGVAVVCTDDLILNPCFVSGRDIVISESNTDEIYRNTYELISNLAMLKSISQEGQRSAKKIYHPDIQVGARARLLQKFIESYNLKI